MATFNESLTRLRRFLRDPDANIWTSEMVRVAFNASQLEIAQKGIPLETVNVYHWPPQWTYTYIHDWEIAHTEGDRTQVLSVWQANSMSICHTWETSYWLEGFVQSEEGDCLTIPWEVGYATPNAPIPMPLHQQIHRPIFAAYDKEYISPISQREISIRDRDYKTRTGKVLEYYRPDDYHNEVVLYPRPSSITWQEIAASDSFSDTLGEGIIAWAQDSLDFSDTGIITDTIDAANALLMVFQILPTDVSSDATTWDDALDWPDYMVKYVEYATLERLFGADNDGFIPSLRDFWATRKNIGINALKTYRRRRMADRDFVMGQVRKTFRPYLRLPSGYPAV